MSLIHNSRHRGKGCQLRSTDAGRGWACNAPTFGTSGQNRPYNRTRDDRVFHEEASDVWQYRNTELSLTWLGNFPFSFSWCLEPGATPSPWLRSLLLHNGTFLRRTAHLQKGNTAEMLPNPLRALIHNRREYLDLETVSAAPGR